MEPAGVACEGRAIGSRGVKLERPEPLVRHMETDGRHDKQGCNYEASKVRFVRLLVDAIPCCNCVSLAGVFPVDAIKAVSKG